MYKHILVPLDGSPVAEQVLPYVAHLAKEHQALVHLLRVLDSMPSDMATARRTTLKDIARGMKVHVQEYLEGIRTSQDLAETKVSCSIKEGGPAQQIVEEAEKEPDKLIAMSTHGRSGIGRWVLGSIADKVLHATTNPLLLVRATEERSSPDHTKINSIIVPLDGSELSEQVLPYVVAMAQPNRLKVVLVRVAPSTEEYYSYMSVQHLDASSSIYHGPYEEFFKEENARMAEYLHGVKARLMKEGLSVEEKLLRGNAATAIVEFAQLQPGALIAMTTHGRSRVGRWVMGSVADKVVRLSGEPVLVVRVASNDDNGQ